MNVWLVGVCSLVVLACKKEEHARPQSEATPAVLERSERAEQGVSRRGIELVPEKSADSLDTKPESLLRAHSGESPVGFVKDGTSVSWGPYLTEYEGIPRGTLVQAVVPNLRFSEIKFGGNVWVATEGELPRTLETSVKLTDASITMTLNFVEGVQSSELMVHWIHEDTDKVRWWTDKLDLRPVDVSKQVSFHFPVSGRWFIDVADTMSYTYLRLNVEVKP